MKKILLNISLALALGFSISSCNDWLDGVEQTSTVSDEIVWQDEAYVDKYVNAFYTYLNKYGQFGEAQFSGSLTESLTETFKYGSVALGDRAGHPNNYVTNPDVISPDGCRYNIWDKDLAYGNIRQMNQFLVMQKKYSTFPDDKNLKWEAQVRFFRAYVYFQLAKRHGGVIQYDDLPTSNDKARSTAAETWQFIADDLDFAATNLPKEWDAANKGRVTKGAAYALKSRAMLYAERWQDAYDAADEVEKLQLYDLVDNYADAWKGNNKEAILEFDYNKDSGPNHTFDQYYVPQCDGYDFGALGTPTQEMVESYEYADGSGFPDWSTWHTAEGTTATPPYDKLEPRFKATILYNGATWKGRTIASYVNGTDGWAAWKTDAKPEGRSTTGYYLRKLVDETHSFTSVQASTQPWTEIRYAEVLLNHAEACYHLSGYADKANKDIKDIRNRVGLPYSDKSGEDLMKAIRQERKVELAYEGHYYWDMRRWKLSATAFTGIRLHGLKIEQNANGSFNYIYVECDDKDRNFPTKMYRFPMPQAELDNNGAVTQYAEWQ